MIVLIVLRDPEKKNQNLVVIRIFGSAGNEWDRICFENFEIGQSSNENFKKCHIKTMAPK